MSLYTQAGVMPDVSEFVSIQQAAHALKFHPESVRRLLRHKALEGRKLGASWLVLRSSVEDYRRRFGEHKFDPRRK
jgi:hypothetical protein